MIERRKKRVRKPRKRVLKRFRPRALERVCSGAWNPIDMVHDGDLVEPSGIEPLTSTLPVLRSPS